MAPWLLFVRPAERQARKRRHPCVKGQIALLLFASLLFSKLPYQQFCLARRELHLQDVGLSKVVQHGEVSHTLRCASRLLRPPASACVPCQRTGVLYGAARGGLPYPAVRLPASVLPSFCAPQLLCPPASACMPCQRTSASYDTGTTRSPIP